MIYSQFNLSVLNKLQYIKQLQNQVVRMLNNKQKSLICEKSTRQNTLIHYILRKNCKHKLAIHTIKLEKAIYYHIKLHMKKVL